MKLYLAAVYTSNFGKTSTIYAKLNDTEKKWRDTHPYILESYHYIHKESYVTKIKEDGLRVFLDSGAFSSFTKGVEIDIPSYCQYVKDNWQIIEEVDGQLLFSVLDKISFTDKVESARGTKENQQIMEKWFQDNGCPGVAPLPCFHYGEPVEYLQEYVARYKYITLGGMVPVSTGSLAANAGGKTGLYAWLDDIWAKYLTNSDGSPKVKVHGFGLTTVDLMERYPWYSVDSSSWVQIAVHGNILIPENKLLSEATYLAGDADPYRTYEKDKNVAVSNDSPRRKETYYHITTLPDIMREAITQYVEDNNFDLERLKSSAYSRWAWNFFAFNQINARTNRAHKKFKPEQRGLF